ncbi:general transcription factor IIF subunit 1-like, partial [Centruroides sculpturatus]|uniref:general transcription factor IIF subunit 1-like n=1 Tax=Centruroides sculpturatus TaxID=218467 RepID=UPI000C6DD9AA
ARLERENNIKEFKTDEDLPKYGAGSEFGREQREEARKKKHGIVTKKYNPEDQPWILEVGGRGGKKFKGIREGGVAENTSYYVFMQAPDGVFEAFPVSEWYNFAPIQRYKALTAEEAEEQYNKYDIKISDMDEWLTDSDDDERDDENNDNDKDDAGDKQKKKKKKESITDKKKKKKKEHATDDEAVEESDEGDFDDREVDYISNSSESEEEPEEEKINREMKGVEDEEALRKLDLSEDEEENEETKETPETEETVPEEKPPVKEKVKAKKAEAASSGESTSESDDSDFDDSKFHSAMFMQKPKKNGSDNSASSSRANTPTKMLEGKKSMKRKLLASDSSHFDKKAKIDSQPGTPTMANSSDGITEEAVRRYLMRKPMTTTELLQKFKSKKTGLTSDQLVTTIAKILKKLNPEKQKIKGKLYLSIKQQQ